MAVRTAGCYAFAESSISWFHWFNGDWFSGSSNGMVIPHGSKVAEAFLDLCFKKWLQMSLRLCKPFVICLDDIQPELHSFNLRELVVLSMLMATMPCFKNIK